ncbi:MAG: hypothetical protein RR313_12575 [Anaerovoracaceae bacterium]
MDIDNWKKYISHRSDISASLVYLTKPNEELNTLEVLMKILEEQTIQGGANTRANGVP